MFCKMILDYENYEETMLGEEVLRRRHTSSPLGSTGSGAESSTASFTEEPGERGVVSPVSSQLHHLTVSDRETDEEDEDDITCYCKKPYAGRPMIECSSCGTWVHLACARVKRSAIPEVWNCHLCKVTKSTKGGGKSRARTAGRHRRKVGSAGSTNTSTSSNLIRPASKRKSH